MTARDTGFDRLRIRSAQSAPGPTPVTEVDAAGRQALYSRAEVLPPFGSVTVDCSACHHRSTLLPWAALMAAFPSVHLPLPWLRYRSWLRCPACRRHTWVRLGLLF